MGDININKAAIVQLEKIKSKMILNHLTELDFNNDDEIHAAYDLLINKTFVKGEFNEIFPFRAETIDLCSNYNYLCFYNGKYEDWLDSCEGVTLGNEQLVAESIIASYNFLLNLAKGGNEDVLRFLSKFQGHELFKNSSVIASLRKKFGNDIVLGKILDQMSKENGQYKNFTDEQKIIMCSSPNNILFKKEDDKYNIVSGDDLEKSIIKKFIDEDDYPVRNISSTYFMQAIEEIQYDDFERTKR